MTLLSKIKDHKNSAVLLCLFMTMVLSLPSVYLPVKSGLDSSWIYGLHKAKIDGLIVGKDIYFTYGPLGYLMFPIYVDRQLWAQAVIFSLFIHLLMFITVYWFLKRNKEVSLIDFVMFFSVLTIVYQHDMESRHYIYLLIAAFVYIVNGRKDYRVLVPIVFGFGIFFYFKFSFGISLFCTFVLFLVLLLKERRFEEVFISLSLYNLFIFLLGLILIGSVSDILHFFGNSIELATGFNAAMANYGNFNEIYLSVFIIVLYFSLLLYAIIVKKRQLATFGVLFSGFFFFLFKYAIIRVEPLRTAIFMADSTLVFALLYLSTKHTLHKYLGSFLAVFIFVLALGSFYINVYNTSGSVTSYTKAKAKRIAGNLNLIINELMGEISDHNKLNKAVLSQTYHLSPQTVKMIDNQSVDIFTFEIAMVELYGFNWSPRPVFQSYSAYTTHLDSLNEKHFKGHKAPMFVLYSSNTIDNKKATFFEPKTLRTLLTDYDIVSVDGDFTVFRRKQTHENLVEKRLYKVETAMNAAVKLPNPNHEGPYFVGITVHYNILGKLIMFMFKPPPIYIQFKNNTGSFTYRLTISNCQNGLFYNPFVGKTGDSSIAVQTSWPNLFQEQIKMDFFKLVNAA